MKITNYLFAIFFFICSTLYSQKTTYIDSTYHENFDKAKLWNEWNSNESKANIKDGYYEIQHLRTSGSWAFWKAFKIDYTKDYTIEVAMEQLNGSNEYGHGIIWGYSTWDNYASFVISPNGYFNISKTTEGKYSELQAWKQTTFVNSGTNKLKIEKKQGKFTFYLNDNEVYSTKDNNIKVNGAYNGLILYNSKTVKVHELKIRASMEKINLIADAIKGYKKENLGTTVNSKHTEIGPIVSPDGKTLFFTRKNHPKNIGGDANDDIWYSQRNTDGTWSEAKNMGTPINNKGHNMLTSVSADNNKLYIANTYNADGSQKGQGLSLATRKGNNWNVPTDIEIKNFYNNHQYVNNCLSQDNQYLLQAIERKDTKGGADIYVSFLTKNGTYSEPLNLGAIINTSGYETTPFIAADNKTLYFSSNGHAGYGDNDIFVSTRLDDTWKNWSTPLNLGPEINSTDWDAYFTIPASGELAYMVSYENTIGEGDIVRIKLPEAAKPKPVALIKGKVLNKKTNLPLQAVINYFDIETNEEVGSATSNETTGEYNIILQYGKKYSFRANKEHFYAVNDFLDVMNLSEYKEIEKDLYLVPVEIGQTIRLNNIFFDFNKADLKTESYEELDRLTKFLQDNKKIEIEIGGHTDNVGSDEYNQKLSQQRVESVVAYIVSKGIDKVRLQAKGYGESKPIANNDTEEGKSTNRRVEFTILKQ
ncbi:MAG: OmpA family protein [Bacteroidia bacterium]|nr:OmpA family protein [Bacteroidia bacterium]